MRVESHHVVSFARHAFRGDPAFVLIISDPPRSGIMSGACCDVAGGTVSIAGERVGTFEASLELPELGSAHECQQGQN